MRAVAAADYTPTPTDVLRAHVKNGLSDITVSVPPMAAVTIWDTVGSRDERDKVQNYCLFFVFCLSDFVDFAMVLFLCSMLPSLIMSRLFSLWFHSLSMTSSSPKTILSTASQSQWRCLKA